MVTVMMTMSDDNYDDSDDENCYDDGDVDGDDDDDNNDVKCLCKTDFYASISVGIFSET